jgi:hypothetical protein
MGVRIYDLKKNPIIRGASWKFEVNYLEPDGTTPMPGLASATAKLRIARSGDTPIVWTGTINSGTGKITFTLTPVQSAALNFSQATYFLDIEFPSETRTILTGPIPTR